MEIKYDTKRQMAKTRFNSRKTKEINQGRSRYIRKGKNTYFAKLIKFDER